MSDIKVVPSDSLSKPYDRRYVVIEESTGKVLDDAGGYGYKTPQKAHRGWAYKSKPKAERDKRDALKSQVRQWCSDHDSFMDDLMQEQLYTMKDGESFTAEDVRKLLKYHGLKPPFSVAELLRHM
ncbi:MAG: hypothetical protein E6R04_03360 [Spirochaetes bacterium]|nr:MAG: hypothetical protein E6R04_03360 [Spirochaetota bacterium]